MNEILDLLVAKRMKEDVSLSEMASALGITPDELIDMESSDMNLSTVQKYIEAIGYKVQLVKID